MMGASNGSFGVINLTLNPGIIQSTQVSLNWPYIAAELVIAFLCIFGNLLFCVAVFRNKRLRTVTNYFLVSLAVADFLVGALAIPCAIITDLGLPYHNFPLCIFVLYMLIILTQSSIFSLLAVAIERYIAIILPFHYQNIMKPRNARLAIVLIWLLASLMGVVPLIGLPRRYDQISHCIFVYVVNMTYMVYFNCFGSLLTPLVAMFVIYAHIFTTVRKHIRQITAMQTMCEVQAMKNMAIRRKVRKATSIFLLLLFFIVCWIPLHIINCVKLFCPQCIVPLPVVLTTVILSHANSVLNPLLYVYRMKSFRQTFKSILLCHHESPLLGSSD